MRVPWLNRIDDGSPAPLGATWDGKGVNFALFSAHAAAVELCLFEPTGRREIARIPLPCRTDQVWHAYVAGVHPGQLYGYRVHGRYEPRQGHRFNPHKLLIDPYARLLHGSIRWHDALYGHRPGAHRTDLADRRDSAPFVPKGIVEQPGYCWGEDRSPRRPWTDTLIYEAHVKGLTELKRDVPLAMRGTFAALGHPAVVDHLVKLGVTAVELMPVHAFADDRFLVEKGLRNYWGYSTLAFFAPEPRYLGEAGVIGFKSAVRTLHEAGIEIILDVVYNHTAEGNHLGPTLSFRGIDNAAYYKLVPDDPRLYWDTTGTGNTLDLSHPRVLQMVLDSLRHWVEAYHVDGFRFDLATSLARDPHAFSERAGFLQAITQDPVLSRVKLIAEPWDLGDGGYRLGGFPAGWSEWNDRFRDTVRAFWRGDDGQLPHLARVITGSRELYEPRGRHPWASVNYVTCHDGFTLEDLVSYTERRNEANGEENRDGHPHNLSWNCGAEGATDDAAVLSCRARGKRNLLATLMLSQGVPHQEHRGNNNAYAQDNEVSWLEWQEGAAHDPNLLAFVQALSGLRRRYAALRRRAFWTGQVDSVTGLKDVVWLAPEGREMTTADWTEAGRRSFGMQFGNQAADGQRLLLLVNAAARAVAFRLAESPRRESWTRVFDTTRPIGLVRDRTALLVSGGTFSLQPRSVVLFQHTSSAEVP